tara:strand:+ start:91 stop:285 length:195 start_codon:yes stop_codon:yes gene_type:complete
MDETQKKLRVERDFLLTTTDFYMSVRDYPMTDAERVEVLEYRQALRDLPANLDKTFPQKPAIIK